MSVYNYAGPIIFNLVIVTVLLISYRVSQKKTKLAIKEGYSSAKSIFPIFLLMLFIMGFMHNFLSEEFISRHILDISGSVGYLGAALIGSVVHIPPFIAFPIGGQILQSGVNAGIIAVLINTLIMVHIFTIPIEIKELGLKFALVRNGLSFIGAIIIGLIIGVLF